MEEKKQLMDFVIFQLSRNLSLLEQLLTEAIITNYDVQRYHFLHHEATWFEVYYVALVVKIQGLDVFLNILLQLESIITREPKELDINKELDF